MSFWLTHLLLFFSFFFFRSSVVNNIFMMLRTLWRLHKTFCQENRIVANLMQLTFNLFPGPLSRNNLLQSEGKVSVKERLITPVELWAYSSTHSTCHRNLKKAMPQIKFNVKTWRNKNTVSGSWMMHYHWYHLKHSLLRETPCAQSWTQQLAVFPSSLLFSF